MVEEETPNEILCVSFNQDNSCFAIGTQTGYRIYSSYPFKDSVAREMDGGIGLIEMYNRSNIITLVGGGAKPKFPITHVIMWNEIQNKMINELRFATPIKNIKIVSEQLFIACELKLFIFNFSSLEKIDAIETANNPLGLLCVSLYNNIHALGYLNKTKGMVTVKFYDNKTEPISILAHKSEIGFIAINLDATLLATTSFKGRMIRVFNIQTKALVYEARRGIERALISSLCFDPLSHFMSCSSDKKRVHIYKLTNNLNIYQIAPESQDIEKENNTTTGFGGFLKKISLKFKSKRNSASLNNTFASLVQDYLDATCTIGIDNMLHIVCKEGKYTIAIFDPEIGGDCQIIEEHILKI